MIQAATHPHETGAHARLADHGMSPAWLVTALVVMLAAQQFLLWQFLGHMPGWAWLLGPIALAGFCALLLRLPGWSSERGPSLKLFAVCVALSAILFVLGGEGRLFYANTDWQVRNSVLHDLVEYPWPYVYTVRATPDLLRAPLGMYLAPALAGKVLGQDAAQWALVLQNSLFLGTLLALGSTLFAAGRPRWIALGVFIGFSGMDILGAMLAGLRLSGHLEWWNVAQFSSTVTLAYWVPQHALAGWAGALLFLLWRENRIPLAAFLVPLPLLAIWSPLGLMGAIPFAAFAGVETLVRRRLTVADFLMPFATALFAIPGLLYLAAGSGAVGGQANQLPLSAYIALEIIDVVPILLAVAFQRPRFGNAVFALVAALLLAAPFGQVGHHQDFPMRFSIAPLAVLALMAGDALIRWRTSPRPFWRAVLIVVLAIGLATPLSETRRAIVYPPAPRMLCSYFGMVPGGADTYVTPLATVPRLIAPPHPAMIRPVDPPRCYAGEWPDP